MNRQAGFTLTELVVGMAMMVLVMAGLAPLLMTLLGNGAQGMSLTDRQQEVRCVLDMVAQDVRYSMTPFTTTGAANELVFHKYSNGATEKVQYAIGTDPGGSGNLVLIRTAWLADGTKLADNPVYDPNRYYMRNTDFAATVTTQTVTVGGATYDKVTQVDIVCNLRQSSTDNNPVTVRTTVHPLNGPHTE